MRAFPVHVPLEWHDEAACAGVKDVTWFPQTDKPGGRTAAHLANVARAKAICATCPVQAQCLAAALIEPQTAGIWGGLTANERKGRYKPARPPRAKCGTDSGYTRHRNAHEPPCQDCKDAHAIAARVKSYARATLR